MVNPNLRTGAWREENITIRERILQHLQYVGGKISTAAFKNKHYRNSSWDNVIALKAMLRGFELASGLKINFAKSQVGIFGAEVNWIHEAAEFLNCRHMEIPFYYLGIPIGAKSTSSLVWEPLIRKYEDKLSKWNQKILSMAGKVTLINSVLTALPIYKNHVPFPLQVG